MSKWDELKEKYGSWKMLGTDITPLLWDEGDVMQDEVKELKFELSCNSEALGKTFNKLADEQKKRMESEALLQLANARCNVLAKQLGETQDEVRFYRSECEVAVKRAEEAEQKLETLEKEIEDNNKHWEIYFSESMDAIRIRHEKLEAIRGLIPKLKCDRCIGWVGDPCSETCGYLIFKKIREVLGVLGVQEKEQQ